MAKETSKEELEGMSAAAKQLTTELPKVVAALNDISTKLTLMAQISRGINIGPALQQMQDMDKAASRAAEAMAEVDSAAKKANETLKQQAGTLSKMGGIAQGIRSAFSSMLKGIKDNFDTVISAASNLASLVKRGLNVISTAYEGLMTAAVAFYNAWNAQEREIVKNFGSVTSGLAKDTMQFAMNSGMLAAVLGDVGDRARYYNEIMEKAGPMASYLNKAFQESSGNLVLLHKALGIADEDLVRLSAQARASGDNLEKSLMSVKMMSDGVAKTTGDNSKMLSRDVAKAMNDVGLSANVSSQKVVASVAYIRQFGAALSEVNKIVQQFSSFDKAAEAASHLAVGLGVMVDPMKMLKAETPAEMIEQMRDAFARAGVSADQMNRHELGLLASQTGLNAETARLVFSMKNQGKSFDEISKSADFNKVKTIDQAEATRMLADAAEKMAASLKPGLIASFFSDFAKGAFDTLAANSALRNVGKTLEVLQQAGRQFGKILGENLPGFKALAEAISKIFDPERFSGSFGKINDAFARFVQGTSSFKDFIKTAATELGLLGSNGYSSLSNLFSSLWTELKRIAGEIADWIKNDLWPNYLSGPFNDLLGFAAEALGKGFFLKYQLIAKGMKEGFIAAIKEVGNGNFWPLLAGVLMTAPMALNIWKLWSDRAAKKAMKTAVESAAKAAQSAAAAAAKAAAGGTSAQVPGTDVPPAGAGGATQGAGWTAAMQGPLKMAAYAAVLIASVYLLAKAIAAWKDVDWTEMAKAAAGIVVLMGLTMVMMEFSKKMDMSAGQIVPALLAMLGIVATVGLLGLALQQWDKLQNMGTLMIGIPLMLLALVGDLVLVGFAVKKFGEEIALGLFALLGLTYIIDKLGIGLSRFQNMTGALKAAGIAMVGLSALVYAIGMLIEGPQALLLGAGLLAMGMIAAAIYGMGYAVKQFADALVNIEKIDAEKVLKNINKMKEIGTSLREIGSSMAPSLGGFVSGLLGQDMVSKIRELETVDAAKLTSVATALKDIATSLQMIRVSVDDLGAVNVGAKMSSLVKPNIMGAKPEPQTFDLKGGLKLTVNMNVTMDVGKMEQFMINRQDSVIYQNIKKVNPNATLATEPVSGGAIPALASK